jgi:hypothetical protein
MGDIQTGSILRQFRLHRADITSYAFRNTEAAHLSVGRKRKQKDESGVVCWATHLFKNVLSRFE